MRNQNYSPGQLIKFRRKMGPGRDEYFDIDWVYAICLSTDGDGYIRHFCEDGHDETVLPEHDDVEKVDSIDDIPISAGGGQSDHDREVFKLVVGVLEERIQQGKSLFRN